MFYYHVCNCAYNFELVALIFDPEKLAKIGKSYDIETTIQLKLPTEHKAEGSERSEGFGKGRKVNEPTSHVELTNKHYDLIELFKQVSDNNSKNVTTQHEKQFDSAVKPSEPSEPSGLESASGYHRDPNISNTIYRLGHSDIFEL